MEPPITFEGWLSEVDRHLVSVVGLAHEDITDKPWRDWFDDGRGPRGAVKLALRDEGIDVA